MIDELAEWIETTFTKYREMPDASGLVPDGVSTLDSAIIFASQRQESSGSESPAQNTTSSGMGVPRAESSRIAGQTITEKELVRRRRLQDSHLFD